jgi:hypothetical protein
MKRTTIERTFWVPVLALLLLTAIPSVRATDQPAVQCDGINVNVQPQLYYMDDSPVNVQVGVIAETNCNFDHIPITLTVTETDNGRVLSLVQFESGTVTSLNLGTLSKGIYPVSFVATGGGMSDSVDSNLFVVPPPCHYQAWFNEDWQGAATSFTFVPMDTCTYTITTTYNGQPYTESINYTAVFETSPPAYNITLPSPSQAAVVEVTITDSNGWTDAWNQCSQQQLTYNECPAYINVNDASTAYPYASDTPLHLAEGLGASIAFLVVVVWIAGRRRGTKATQEEEFEEAF